jgi:two-component system response regulator NreC
LIGSEHQSQPPITIVLADDHTVMRNGLRMLLDSDAELRVVSEVGSIPGVFGAVRTHRPDVLLLDLNMPGGSSVAAIPRLRRMSPTMKIVVLTMEREPVFVREAYDAGASGYVLKDSGTTELLRAIRAAAERPTPG